MILVANVEYVDGTQVEEVRGYLAAVYRDGVVQFMWETELLTIPLHRVKCISEIHEKEHSDA